MLCLCCKQKFINISEFTEFKICKFCGLGISNNIELLSSTSELSPMHRFNFLFEKIVKVLNYSRAFCIFLRLRARKFGNLLDFGCGRGETLKLFSFFGWEVIGVEHDNKSAADAKNSKLSVVTYPEFQIYIDKWKLNIDLVTFLHNLEHLKNPREILNSTKNLLKNDGEIYIEVPNFHSLQSKIARNNWVYLDLTNHYFHFTRYSLALLLEDLELNYRFLNSISFKFGPLGMALSIASRIPFIGNQFSFKKLVSVDFKSTLLFMILIIIFPICTILEFISIIFRSGSVIKVKIKMAT